MKTGDQFVIYEDITEFKHVVKELRESEERFKTLFEYAPDAYYLNDLKGVFIDGNLAAEKMIGYKREELIGKSFLELNIFPKEEMPNAANHLAKNAAGQAYGPDEFTLIKKDGSLVAAEIRTIPTKIKGKSLVLGIARDITLRKKAERDLQKAHDKLEKRVEERTAELAEVNRQLDAKLEDYRRAEIALKKSEAKYRFITEWMADIIWTLDMNLRTTYVSPSIEKVLGFTPEEKKEQPLEEMITPASLQRAQLLFLTELQREEKEQSDPNRAITIDLEYYRKDGLTIWLENVFKAIWDKKGQIAGLHGVSRDITKRKQIQEALIQERDRLQDAVLKIKKLSGLLPICSSCKKIRNDKGYWNLLETYIQDHSEAEFTHSICPDCAKELYPDVEIY
jgi:PAS domain S-box-containing protein